MFWMVYEYVFGSWMGRGINKLSKRIAWAVFIYGRIFWPGETSVDGLNPNLRDIYKIIYKYKDKDKRKDKATDKNININIDINIFTNRESIYVHICQ